jgi:hypothetical protein
MEIAGYSGSGSKTIPTTTGHSNFIISGMKVLFHRVTLALSVFSSLKFYKFTGLALRLQAQPSV